MSTMVVIVCLCVGGLQRQQEDFSPGSAMTEIQLWERLTLR